MALASSTYLCWKGQIILLISWVIFFIIASISFVIIAIVVAAAAATAAGKYSPIRWVASHCILFIVYNNN